MVFGGYSEKDKCVPNRGFIKIVRGRYMNVDNSMLLKGIDFIKRRLHEEEIISILRKNYDVRIDNNDNFENILRKIQVEYFHLKAKPMWSGYHNLNIPFTKEMVQMSFAQTIAGVRYSSAFILLMERLEEFIDIINGGRYV